jgi:hypothetical protein
MILRINRNYFPAQRQPTGLHSGKAVYFLLGKDRIFKYYLDELWFQRVNAVKQVQNCLSFFASKYLYILQYQD